uniref:Uncharacterized protein n=1 Tax=Anopheles atroparvus TaxID=41427 RepID=A0A182JN41_ANOAO
MFATIFAIHYDARGWLGWALWNIYRLLPVLVNVSYFYKAYRLWINQDEDNTTAAVIVASMWGFTEASLRITVIEGRYRSLSKLMCFLNVRTYCPVDAPRVHRQRAALFDRNNRIILLLVGTMLLQALWFMTTQLFNRDAFMLQLNGKVVQNAGVQITYGLLSNIWGMIHVLPFGLLYITMNIFELEMKIILEAVTNLETTLTKYLRTFHKSRLQVGESSCEEQKVFWDIIQQELNKHISRHVDLLDNLREYSLIVGPFAFVQYYGTFALIADCGFILSIEGLSSNSFIYILFATVLVFESFLICRGIEKLNGLNEAIGQALYTGFDWPGLLQYTDGFRSQYQSVRHSLLLIIGRSQKGFQCSYGGLGGISMERFAQLMQNSYSLLTILLQFAK